MKKLKYVLLIMILPALMMAQNRSINKFYRSHKKDAGAVNISLPGWILKLGAGIGKRHVDEDERELLKYVKHIKKMKVLILEDGNSVSKEESRKFMKSVRKKGMEELIYIKDEETNVSIMVKEKKNKIRNIMIFVRDDEELVFVSLKTKIKMEDINNLIRDAIGPELFEKVEKKSAPKIPQA